MCKAWVVLVTFANSRGIYLNSVADCTSKCCVDALERFVNSRRAPKIVSSDILLVLVFKILQPHQVFTGNST